MMEALPLYSDLGHLSCLDYLCLLLPDRSRRILAELFAAGKVRSNGRPISPRSPVGELRDLVLHQTVESIDTMFAQCQPAGERLAVADPTILHEDGRLVVLAKPAGLPVVPARDRGCGSCLEFLTRREMAIRVRKAPAEYVRYRVAHRIDRMTSGVVILAKTPEAERQLGADLAARRVVKEYDALLSGCVAAARVRVLCPIAPGRRGKMRVVADDVPAAKAAETRFDVIERFGCTTWVRAIPATGRQHQIRVHAWAFGHPLAIDPLYRGAQGCRAVRDMHRLTLHASRYELPRSWALPRAFVAPLPDDFAAAIAALQASAQ